MHFPLRHRPRNVGREDRLVRACVALSLMLLGGFAALTAGRFSAIVLGFVVGFAYFALTAALAWDPFYASQRIDTRPEVPHDVDPLIDADPFSQAERRWPVAGGQPTGEATPDPVLVAPRYTSVVDLTDSPTPAPAVQADGSAEPVDVPGVAPAGA